MISMLVVHSAQTVHPSCAEINTISKRIEMSFHLIHYIQNNYWAYGTFGTNRSPILCHD
jgi:hypothetical protein